MENTLVQHSVSLDVVQFENELFFKIANSDAMRPFFMSIVSDSNHWLFISSNGGLSAGRKNASHALFPYYTDDKITESTDITGSKSIFWIKKGREDQIWEPFSERFEGKYAINRNLYKNRYGNKIVFEEINHDLQLTFQYQWNSSNEYGFVRKSKLINHSDTPVQIRLLDGIQNLLPHGLESDLQNASSNLVDAYKRNELVADAGLGIYALSAIIVDRAEPSEALSANVAWSLGLENPTYLVSPLQVKQFRRGGAVYGETDVKGEKGAYLLVDTTEIAPNANKEWLIVANVNQSHAAIARLVNAIKQDDNLAAKVQADVELGTKKLISLVAASDGLQLTKDQFRDARHFSNTMFNIMRGGIFDNNYQIEQRDFKHYLAKANHQVYERFENTIKALPELFSLFELKKLAQEGGDKHFMRLCFEYMPLKFSRRHGDPSRPWNKFSINTRNEVDGSKILDYQGNWRDIFQNWEALAHSYPEFIESMIHKFLNASTFDGYNPYRVTKDGFDWETIEPDDPWAYIGYWGDHQLIYFLKYLEFTQKYYPSSLEKLFNANIFVYANIPYKIKSYADLLENSKDTIEFDEHLDQQIRQHRKEIGADGALLKNRDGVICQVNFIEKILASVLAKISNFIPEGGIWMNTQRPEWNDANNALVGNGVSMVTLYYLHRYLNFFKTVFESTKLESAEVSEELATFFHRIVATLKQQVHLLNSPISNRQRKSIMDGLGQAGSDYRMSVYEQSFSGYKQGINLADLKDFVAISLQFTEHSIRSNKRDDNLYHAYNLMTVEDNDEVSISHLSEMLEGQVAVLSAGALSSKEALAVLDGMKKSALFREDQYSYILYPNKNLPGFLQKNNIDPKEVADNPLLHQLITDGNVQIIEKDINGQYHFNSQFRNADDLKSALKKLSNTAYASALASNEKKVLQTFEKVFNHKAFTGRSGTFFGYEGLGSIYWHMVSKLQLAVQECCLKAINEKESSEIIGRLLEHYYEINEGIGVHKPPQLYGAFPTDPYSHTPAGKGAQQPGMTGQVKEDILSRFGELGISVIKGQLCFLPDLLRKDEFLEHPKTFTFLDVHGEAKEIALAVGMLAFTYCQVPIIYKMAEENSMVITLSNGTTQNIARLYLDTTTSQHIFNRTGEVIQIDVTLRKALLK